MGDIGVGHRVVVKADNGYDKPLPSETFGLMAGHFGRVHAIWPDMILVEITGHIHGIRNVSSAVTLDGDTRWPFYSDELEHAD